MKTLSLSDHVSNQAQLLAKQRHQAYEAQLEVYTQVTLRKAAQIAERQGEMRAAFQRRAYWQWFKAWLRLCSAKAQRIGSRPVLAQASDAERVWEAGHEGEQRLTERLAAQMNDDWTLVSGYRNQKGELDAVLVGPEAIVAIEIKNLNGEIHVNGDVWTRDKYDKYGNLVEQSLPITDRGGRSPAQQVNATADDMLVLLKSRFGVKEIYRLVVLTHAKAEVGRVTSPTVHGVVTIDRVDGEALVRRLQPIYDAEMRERIVRCLGEAHARFRANKLSMKRRSAAQV